jgi:phospho-N-acetylmuramoyl-pentapeptide-transferase
MNWDIIKIILPATLTFFMGILITYPISDFLYKHKMWKKKAGKVDMEGNKTPIYDKLYKDRDLNTPRMGGTVIWGSVLITISLFWILSQLLPIEIFNKLDFLSRNQTWIPMVALFIGAIFGLLDDYLEILGTRSEKNKTGGLSFKKRLAIVGFIGIFVSSWFYIKLGIDTVGIPFFQPLYVGFLIIPIFTILILLIYGGGVIDGLDGLSGGIFAIAFSTYGLIAFSLGQIDLAAFCAAIVGGTLAFLWFNIPPARFYMSETGTMALTIVLSIVAFMTDSIVDGIGLFLLPIIGFPLVISIVTSVLQIMSKRFRNGKKILLAAPLHHHLEAIGWPATKVVMRYWVLSIILCFIAFIINIIG